MRGYKEGTKHLDNEKIMSFVFGILGRKQVLQYPCINLDCKLNSNVLHGLFSSEKGNASERSMSLFLCFKWGKYARKYISHECISLREQAVTHFGSPLNIRRVHSYLAVVVRTLELM